MKTRLILLGFMYSTAIPVSIAANIGINIDWPTELSVSCEPATLGRTPGRTDIVVSVTGLEIGRAYDVKLEGNNSGVQHVYPRRSRDPSFLFKKVRPGKYEIRVRESDRNRPVIATKPITITAPELILSAPETISPNTPIKVSLSNTVGLDQRGLLHLTLVPAHYPLNERGPGRYHIKESCDVVQHEFKGLPAGRYELRLFQSSARGSLLLDKKPILVGNAGTPEQGMGTRRAELLQQLEQAKVQLEQLQAQLALQQPARRDARSASKPTDALPDVRQGASSSQISLPASFPLYNQHDASSRIYVSREWADAPDPAGGPRTKYTCLATVYAMIEHARGNSGFKIGPESWNDQVGALGIRGVGGTSTISAKAVLAEFRRGNPVILWGSLPNDRFGHFVLAIGTNVAGEIIVLDPSGGKKVRVDPVTWRVSGGSVLSTIERYRTVWF